MYYGHSTCTMATLHIRWPQDMQVGGSGGRSPLGKQGGLGGPQAPPTAGPPCNGADEGGGYMRIPSRVIPRDDVILEDFLKDFLDLGKILPLDFCAKSSKL